MPACPRTWLDRGARVLTRGSRLSTLRRGRRQASASPQGEPATPCSSESRRSQANELPEARATRTLRPVKQRPAICVLQSGGKLRRAAHTPGRRDRRATGETTSRRGQEVVRHDSPWERATTAPAPHRVAHLHGDRLPGRCAGLRAGAGRHLVPAGGCVRRSHVSARPAGRLDRPRLPGVRRHARRRVGRRELAEAAGPRRLECLPRRGPNVVASSGVDPHVPVEGDLATNHGGCQPRTGRRATIDLP